jgi:hypothetical protein
MIDLMPQRDDQAPPGKVERGQTIELTLGPRLADEMGS